MILGFVCIIIFAIALLAGKPSMALKNIGLNSLSAMALLFLAAVLNLFSYDSATLLGFDMLSLLLAAVAVYAIFWHSLKRLAPIFGGILGVFAMSILVQYAMRQLAGGALVYAIYIAVMGATIFIVSNVKEAFIVGALGIALSQLIISIFSSMNVQAVFKPIGGVILASLLVAFGIEGLCYFTHKKFGAKLIKSKQ